MTGREPGQDADRMADGGPARQGEQGVERELEIVNVKGLHARASARFVEVVEAHDASASVTREGVTVSGDSIMGLLMLAAHQGSRIHVRCTGPEAAALAEALEQLVRDRFGEEA